MRLFLLPFQRRRGPADIRLVLVVAILFIVPYSLPAQARSQPWVFGASFGLTTSPPTQFYTDAMDASKGTSSCAPNLLPSLNAFAGRRFVSWLRTDLALAAHIARSRCDVAVNSGSFIDITTLQYVGRSTGYDFVAITLRGVVESAPTDAQSRLIAAIGCICEKHIPLVQLGAGLSAGGQHARFTMEAGGQLLRIPWARLLRQYDSASQAITMEWIERGTSWRSQIWIKVGVEAAPRGADQ